MDQVGFDATARNPHPFFNHAAPTIREMPSQNTSPANTTTANTTADNTTAANPTPDGLAAKDAIHIDAATVARPVLKVSDVLTTLHKAFRSGDSAVEKFVDAIVADPAIANENNSDNPRASSRQNDNGLRLMAAEYQAMRRVDKTLAFSLMTQDGDQVQIDMSAFQSASSMRSIQNEVDETAFSTAAGAAFNYAVKGELDEEELQAIDELMTKLSGAVFSFYM